MTNTQFEEIKTAISGNTAAWLMVVQCLLALMTPPQREAVLRSEFDERQSIRRLHEVMLDELQKY